jgi:hypothetical protein
MIFPKKKKMLQTYESAKSGGWLSRKICEGEMAILLLTTVAWQCLILLGEAEMFFKLNFYKTPGSLVGKLDKTAKNPEELSNMGAA